jgi:hypothetical protein
MLTNAPPALLVALTINDLLSPYPNIAIARQNGLSDFIFTLGLPVILWYKLSVPSAIHM